MRNEVIFDKSGIPDIMVAFTPDELGLPAELRGRKVSEYLISKYPNTLINGVPHSLPFQKPAVDINHDKAIELCEAKGPGWHLTTNDEWAALALWSWEHDTLPTGNTNSGKSHSHPEQSGTTYENSYGKTLTGSGPVAYQTKAGTCWKPSKTTAAKKRRFMTTYTPDNSGHWRLRHIRSSLTGRWTSKCRF